MEKGRNRVFFSYPAIWIPLDWTWNDGFQPVIEQTIYNSLTNEDIISNQRNRVLETADEKKIEKVRKQIQKEVK